MAEGREERRSVTLLWRIEKVSQLEDGLSSIESSCVEARSLENTEWYLAFYPRGEKEDDKNIRLTINLDRRQLNIPVDIECSILASDGSPLCTGTLRDQLFRDFLLVDLPVCPTQEEVFVTKKSSFLPCDTMTVRCRIWKSKEEIAQFEYFSLLSRNEVRKSTFLWSIKNFSSLRLEEKVDAPRHPQFFSDHPGIKIQFSLGGASLVESKVKFNISEPNESYAVIKLEALVLDATENMIKCIVPERTLTFFDNCILPASLSRRELMEEISGCLDDDVLTLFWKINYVFSIKSIMKTYYGPLNLFEDRERNARTPTEVLCRGGDAKGISEEMGASMDVLRSDLQLLYQEKTFSDFELRSNDVSFPVHKCVLSARSPVFKAMFSSDKKESNFLDVPDLNSNTLNRFLNFLYTGTVENMRWEDASQLYYAANKYGILSLTRVCRTILRSCMKTSNVCATLVLADKHKDQELKLIVDEFILNDFESVLRSKEWKDFVEKDPISLEKTSIMLLKKKF